MKSREDIERQDEALRDVLVTRPRVRSTERGVLDAMRANGAGRNDASPPLARSRIRVGARGLRWHWTVRPHYLQTADTPDKIIPCDGGTDEEMFTR